MIIAQGVIGLSAFSIYDNVNNRQIKLFLCPMDNYRCVYTVQRISITNLLMHHVMHLHCTTCKVAPGSKNICGKIEESREQRLIKVSKAQQV